MQSLVGACWQLSPPQQGCLSRRLSLPPVGRVQLFRRCSRQHPSNLRQCLHTASVAATSVGAASAWVPQLADWSFAATAVYLGAWTTTALGLGPRKGWHTSNAVFAPLAALYAILLVASWEPTTLSLILPGSLKEGFSGGLKPQFLPQVSGIQQLFSRPITAASLMVHLASINLFAARDVLLKGGHSVWGKVCTILCITMGPIGLLAASLWMPWDTRQRRAHEAAGLPGRV